MKNKIDNQNVLKKKLSSKWLIILLVAILCISALGFYGYARYITQINGTAKADIAGFIFKVNDKTDELFVIDLGTTRKEVEQPANVQDGYIGPGTAGKFDLIIDATGSETSLEYEIKMNIDYENNARFPKNLIFYYDSDMKNAIYHENNIISLNGYIPYSDENKIQTKPIYWRWDYETGQTQNDINENDEADSNWIGNNVSLSINVLGRQVNKNLTSNQCAITFDANGGTIQGYGNAGMTTKNLNVGEQYGELPVPIKEGYTFAGWIGKNLLGIEGRTIRNPGGTWSNSSVRNFNGNGIYIGITANNYWSNEVLEYEIDAIENSVSVATRTSASGYGIGFDLKVEPNTTYSISRFNGNNTINIGEYSQNGTWIKMNYGGSSRTFTTTEKTEWIVIVIPGNGTSNICWSNNIQFEKNSNWTKFENAQNINENTIVNYDSQYVLCAKWIKN